MKRSELELMVGSGEQILWQGKPNKKCFILESIFNPMLIFALIWGAFDLGFIGMALFSEADEMIIFLLLFMVVHLMPVWMYLGGVFFSIRKYKNTAYIITDKGIYISGGAFTYNYEMKPFTDLAHISIHRGIFDQMLGVGDVISVCNHAPVTEGSYGRQNHHAAHGLNICDISDYQEVFKLVKDLQTDIYSDTMYPNDLRPSENHGYNTSYVRNNTKS